MTNRSGRSTNRRDPRGWSYTGKAHKRSTGKLWRRVVRRAIRQEEKTDGR